ncbi:MAG: hypothetical protein WDW36_010133 [Sanguina aurantia]
MDPLKVVGAVAIARTSNIIKLNIGNPGRHGFDAPAHLREAIASHLHDSEAYGHEQGLEIARDAIAAQQHARGARHVDADRIFIGNGVSELIDLSLRALLQSDDEVLLPSPDYPLWSAATILNGGRPRYYRCLASHGHLPDPDEVEALITPRTRALVLINPNNPTGAVYPRALLERLVAVAARHKLLLLCDEIYDEILYDEAVFQPLAEVAGELPCISFGGLSKVHRACGYRVGWMSLSGDPTRTVAYRDALQLLAALRLCANVTAQWAVIPALQGAPTIGALTAPGGRLHDARRAVIEGVAASEFLDLVAPGGALYAFPQVRADRIAQFDDNAFALRLLEEESVLVVPGSSFNVAASRHIRLTLLPQPPSARHPWRGDRGPLQRFALNASTPPLAYLALGDSYTIGEAVPASERWPVQLANRLRRRGIAMGEPSIVATTGWTTDELSAGMDEAPLAPAYDLVTLLIGVNDEYRGRAAGGYRIAFAALLKRAIALAGTTAQRVVVVSIPDWGATPFGQTDARGSTRIAYELDVYNAIARDETRRARARWVDITTVSRQRAELVAEDGLHPSGAQYQLWTNAILPVVQQALRRSD